MPTDRAMPPRNQRNSNKTTNPRIQGDAQSFSPNQQLSTNEAPKQRKKRNQISDQLQQSQQPRQSVFERLGTKNSAATPLPRQAKGKKEIKDHIPVNELRKSRRISESRKAERELSEGELIQEAGKFKDRQPVDAKSKTVPSSIKNLAETIKNNTSNIKSTFRDVKSEKSIVHDTTAPKDQQSEEIQHSSYDTVSHDEISVHDNQNITTEVDKMHVLNLQKVDEETLVSSIDNSNEITIKKRKTSHDDVIEGEESEDAAKEDVVSIQADDDFSLHSDIEEGYSGYLSPPDDGQLPMDQDFIDAHEKTSSQIDQGRERNHEKDLLRSKDSDVAKAYDLSSRIRNRQSSDDGRISEKDRNLDRINRESPIPPHKDDRRRLAYDRDSREKLREERYNRTITTIRDHRDHRPHEIDRDRRERERQERYNQSILEDKAHFDNQRRSDRDRFLREDRGRSEHGNRTPTADTSSNSTVRGGVLSRSSSVSDRDRGGPSRGRSLERLKKEDQSRDRERLRDDISRDREYDSRLPPDYVRERDRVSRQRDDPQRDREQRLHDDLSKEITPSIRKVDEKEVAFRRLDERLSRRLDEHHQIPVTSDRPQRELLNRDREKDNHYQRDNSERLRIEPNRRDERTSNIRQKNDAQNDSVFQDNRGREPGQRNIQLNVQSELDRTEKRKDESEVTERKPYLDREQRGDSLQSIQRLPEYRPREKDRDVRQRDEFVAKDNIRVGMNRDQERELPNRRDDRASGLPDLYRPSSEHLRDIDRRSIREFDRDYRDRDLRGEPVGIDRYRGDYNRDNNQGRDRMIDSHTREVERRLSWELDNRGGTSIFSDKDQMDHRRERERERTREVGHKSRSNSAELKIDSHKHLYDFHQREPERRTIRDVENDQMARTNRTEPIRRSESNRHSLFINDKHHDSSHDFSLDAPQREEQDIELQSKDLKTDQIILKDDEILPDPWQKCMSRKNKVYYFNPITRESRWAFPSEDFGKRLSNESENSHQISPAHDDKIDEYETHNSDDIEIPRKKPRLKSRESAEEKALDDRKDSSNRDIYERKFGYEEQLSLDNYSVKGVSLRDQKIMVDSHTDSISRRPRSNTTSNVITSPSSKSQTSPSMTPQFSPTHRSPAPGYDRRYSADYDHLGGSRRVPYSGSQLQSPPIQLRSTATSFSRNDFYERGDNFRIDEFNSRNVSGSNNVGMVSPGNAQTNVNNRSNRSTMYNSLFGVDQGSIPGNRRTSTMGRGGMSSLNHSIQHRVRSHEDDRNIYNEEGRMDASTEIDEFKINNRNLQTREFSNRTGEKADLVNGVPPNDSTFEVVPDASFIVSDEEGWRTEDEMIDDVLADTEPESLFLFRRSRSSSPTSHLLSDEDIIRRQIAPIWGHITSNVAGDELFQQFEQIMNNGNLHKKKEMKILNSRKEFDRRRAIFGGKRMFRYKSNLSDA
ncbi:23589_t:CDS:2 [Cetraspora pellucida]|uniref:23589_t:CDS:1 n=1 Tax=Cetraspora pellucida TaxID=1433469 RepID=A0A9N9HRS3_9GLOM|nr:23589_t:CDS:2 [Cetraspora pellucida]